LTEHDDVIKPPLRGAPRLGLALGPAPARAGPACHWLLLPHSHSPSLLRMYGRYDNIHSHQVSIVRSRYLLCFIHSMLSAMQQIGYDFQICYDYRLNFAECCLPFISTCAIWKEEKRGFCQQSHLWL